MLFKSLVIFTEEILYLKLAVISNAQIMLLAENSYANHTAGNQGRRLLTTEQCDANPLTSWRLVTRAA